jgi:hypothetical protein
VSLRGEFKYAGFDTLRTFVNATVYPTQHNNNYNNNERKQRKKKAGNYCLVSNPEGLGGLL